MEWDDRIKMTVFTLANQIHDYISYEGAAKEQWDDDTIEKFIEGRDRQIKNKEITMHSRENYDLAIRLIHLSSRQGGLGIMMATKVANDARLASIINCMAALNSRGLPFIISDRTAEFILKNEAHLSNAGITDIRLAPNSAEFRKFHMRETRDLQKRLSDLTQKILENEIRAALNNEHRDLLPLFLDHQGDHANRVQYLYINNRILNNLKIQFYNAGNFSFIYGIKLAAIFHFWNGFKKCVRSIFFKNSNNVRSVGR